MSRILQFKRGTKTQNNTYVGADGEIVIVTDDGYSIYVHDGQNPGGHKASSAEWGSIIGSIQSQTDLWNALLAKVGMEDLGDIDFGLITDSNMSSGTKTFNQKLNTLSLKIGELNTLNSELDDLIQTNNIGQYLQSDVFDAELEEAYNSDY